MTVACHKHGTTLNVFLPASWDHLGCQSWDHPARLAGWSLVRVFDAHVVFADVEVISGGIQGGRVVGGTDDIGAYPAFDPQTPENFAATIYRALGIPQTAAWKDELGRPHHVYHGEPMPGLI